MNLIAYVAHENPEGFRKVLVSFGVDAKAMNTAQMISSGEEVFQQHREAFYEALYDIHPDREILHQDCTTMQDTCILKSLPKPVVDFYSGDYKILKLALTAGFLVWLIRKI